MFEILGYSEATSIEDAVTLLATLQNSKIIAGGTDIIIKARDRKKEYLGLNLIGVTRIPELTRIAIDDAGTICVGGACTFSQIENDAIVRQHIPTLAMAVGTIGGPQIRNVGTIGGNVCNGVTSADSATTLFVHNATIVLQGKSGRREVAVKDFYVGAGKTVLAADEVFVCIKFKKADYEGCRGHYIKFAQRNAMDIANLGCAVLLKLSGSKIEDLRIAFGVAGPTPIRAKSAEDFAIGKELSPELLAQIGKKCLESSNARDSWRASKEYREHLICELPVRAINTIVGGVAQ